MGYHLSARHDWKLLGKDEKGCQPIRDKAEEEGKAMEGKGIRERQKHEKSVDDEREEKKHIRGEERRGEAIEMEE